MSAIGDRRALLRMAMAGALAPLLASRARATVSPGERFDPPQGPMTFTRRLVRDLPGGFTFTVGRGFAVRFAAEGDGWSVTGEQVDVAVDFPERMAALAALERQRKETGLFPLRLDRSGTIVGGPEARPTKELDEAVASVMRGLESTTYAADERKELDAFVRAVHAAGTRLSALLPQELFAPREDATKAQRNLALPGGGEGTIAVSFTAVADPATGLMRKARREIVTTIAADSRLTREDWTLLPA